jgi:hypothetical protein
MKKMHPVYLAKLERMGRDSSIKEFATIESAVSWVTGDGLKALGGKAVSASIHLRGEIVWARLGPMTPEREQAEKEELQRLMIRLSAHGR